MTLRSDILTNGGFVLGKRGFCPGVLCPPGVMSAGVLSAGGYVRIPRIQRSEGKLDLVEMW